MNCRDYRSLVHGSLASSDSAADIGIDDKAQEHAETCDECSELFQKEAADALAALKVATQKEEASARVESELIIAFRAQQRKQRLAIIGRRSNVIVTWASRIAAMLMIAVAAAWIMKVSPSRSKLGDQNWAAPVIEERETRTPHVGPVDPGNGTRVEIAGQSGIQVEPVGRSPRRIASKRGTSRIASKAPKDQRVEIVTDFLPIGQGYNLAPMDGGKMVRVELPRTALWSFGLPMNVERASSRIKADVLLGNDGQARAIRFVQ